MAERIRASPYGSQYPRRVSTQSSSEELLGTRKTMLVLVVVVGCFAILWPKVFYPMLVNSANSHIKPGPIDRASGCCDVISEVDLDTIKIMSELCSTIIEGTGQKVPDPKDIVIQCRKAVLETCGIDISAVLQERVSLGHSVKQILEEVRSLNGSLCLKYNFGVSPWSLGVPHRVHVNLEPGIKQERSSHLRPEMVHPAFKERGRAIPQPEASPARRPGPPPRIIEGRPGPIPGMRPAMGGPGHVVPPSKQSNNGFLGVLMPVYTIGFVVFFTYTIMKLVFKKKQDDYTAPTLYPPVDSDDQFNKEVFEANRNYYHRPSSDTSKIVVNAVSALLEEVNNELEARKQKTAETVLEQDDGTPNGSLLKEEDEEHEKQKEEQGSVTVMGMETTASCEGGKKWSRPDSPVLPHPQPAVPKEPSPPPQQIFLEGSLPPQSQLLVSDAATEAHKDPEDDAPVVLAGKMTLSVISLDSETGTEDSSNSGKKADDEERRTSSGNTSEEFEKINAADLEEQINNIIEEAEIIALNDERRFSLSEELEKFTEEIEKTPQIDEKAKHYDVLEEIKNQLNLEDDLIKSLSADVAGEPVRLPVTDLIKEFLNNEENAILTEVIGVDNIEQEVADALHEENTDHETPEENEELLSKEERDLIAKYEALDAEEFDKTDSKESETPLLNVEDDTLKEEAESFVKQEATALLHENIEFTLPVQENQGSNEISDNQTLSLEQEQVQGTISSFPSLSEDIQGPTEERIKREAVPSNESTHSKDIEPEHQNAPILKESEEILSLPVQETDIPDAKESVVYGDLSINETTETSDINVEIESNAQPGDESILEGAVSSEEDIVNVAAQQQEAEIIKPVVESVLKETSGIVEPKESSQQEEVIRSTESQDVIDSKQSVNGQRQEQQEIKNASDETHIEPVITESQDVPSLEQEESQQQDSEKILDEVPIKLIKEDLDIVDVTESTADPPQPREVEVKSTESQDTSVIGQPQSRETETENQSDKSPVKPADDDEILGVADEQQQTSIVTDLEFDMKLPSVTSEIHERDEVTGSPVDGKAGTLPKSQAELLLQGLGVNTDEEESKDDKKDSQTETKEQESSSIDRLSRDERLMDDKNENDIVEQVIEDIVYEDESDSEDLLQEGPRSSSEELHAEGRLNGVENEISENELENEDDIEIEEIIEYVDNTDEEGEEIIEVNMNQNDRDLENGRN